MATFKDRNKTDSTETHLNILAELNANTDSAMQKFLQRLQRNHGALRMLIFAVLVFAIFASINPRIFLGPINIQNLLVATPEIGILAIAMMIAMLTGGIDLSVISTASFTAIIMSSVYQSLLATNPEAVESMAVPIALLGLAVGLVAGALNGFLIGYVGITPILATLGTMQLINGLAIVSTGGATLYGAPLLFTEIGQGNTFGVPNLFILLILVSIVVAVIVSRTPLGVQMRLLGANIVAAKYSGLPNRRVLLKTYMLTGLLAAIAGIAFIARNPTANADYGASYLLLTIVIVVLGGTNPNGGFASVAGVVLATLILQMISNGFNMLRLSPYEYQIAQGLILLAVMVADHIEWRKLLPRKPNMVLRESAQITRQ